MSINLLKPTLLKKFLIAFLMVALIPLILASYKSYRSAEQELKTSLNESYYLLTQQITGLIDKNYIGNWVQSLISLTTSLEFKQNLDDPARFAILDAYLGTSEQIIIMLVRFSNGGVNTLAKQDELLSMYNRDADAVGQFFKFSGDTRQGLNILPSIILNDGKTAFLPIEIPFEWGKGDTAVIRCIYRLNQVLDAIPKEAEVGHRELYILDDSGKIIFVNENARFHTGEILGYPILEKNIINALRGNARATQIEAFEFEGERFVGNFSITSYTNWAVVVVDKYQWAYALVLEMKKNAILWITIAVFLCIVFSVFFARSFSKSIQYLAGISKKIGEGDFEIKVDIPSRDELGDLAASLQDMAHHLKESVKVREELAAIRQEIEVASKIQQSILPDKVPDLGGLKIYARYIPMAGVAGDFYDFHEISETELGILIADVSGHGIPAALISSMVKITFSLQHQHADIPEKVLSGMNKTLSGKMEDQFLSASYMYLDMDKRRFVLADAGHLPLLIWRRTENKLYRVKPKGMLIGWFEDIDFPVMDFEVKNGDRIIFYTDGIVEAPSPAGECYGEKRFVELIKNNLDKEGDKFIDIVVDTLTEWSDVTESFEDDLTLVVMDIMD